ncbi:MAG: Mth938-like domain-containing protein [Desulfobacteraceae bacterium]
MQIEAYDFGQIVIDGKTYRQDVLILPDRVKDDWWRQQSHLLQLQDVQEALKAGIEILVVGTGMPGQMRVDKALEDHLRQNNIELVTLPTREACDRFNQLSKSRKAAAAFHLTC